MTQLTSEKAMTTTLLSGGTSTTLFPTTTTVLSNKKSETTTTTIQDGHGPRCCHDILVKENEKELGKHVVFQGNTDDDDVVVLVQEENEDDQKPSIIVVTSNEKKKLPQKKTPPAAVVSSFPKDKTKKDVELDVVVVDRCTIPRTTINNNNNNNDEHGINNEMIDSGIGKGNDPPAQFIKQQPHQDETTKAQFLLSDTTTTTTTKDLNRSSVPISVSSVTHGLAPKKDWEDDNDTATTKVGIIETVMDEKKDNEEKNTTRSLNMNVANEETTLIDDNGVVSSSSSPPPPNPITGLIQRPLTISMTTNSDDEEEEEDQDIINLQGHNNVKENKETTMSVSTMNTKPTNPFRLIDHQEEESVVTTTVDNTTTWVTTAEETADTKPITMAAAGGFSPAAVVVVAHTTRQEKAHHQTIQSRSTFTTTTKTIGITPPPECSIQTMESMLSNTSQSQPAQTFNNMTAVVSEPFQAPSNSKQPDSRTTTTTQSCRLPQLISWEKEEKEKINFEKKRLGDDNNNDENTTPPDPSRSGFTWSTTTTTTQTHDGRNSGLIVGNDRLFNDNDVKSRSKVQEHNRTTSQDVVTSSSSDLIASGPLLFTIGSGGGGVTNLGRKRISPKNMVSSSTDSSVAQSVAAMTVVANASSFDGASSSKPVSQSIISTILAGPSSTGHVKASNKTTTKLGSGTIGCPSIHGEPVSSSIRSHTIFQFGSSSSSSNDGKKETMRTDPIFQFGSCNGNDQGMTIRTNNVATSSNDGETSTSSSSLHTETNFFGFGSSSSSSNGTEKVKRIQEERHESWSNVASTNGRSSASSLVVCTEPIRCFGKRSNDEMDEVGIITRKEMESRVNDATTSTNGDDTNSSIVVSTDAEPIFRFGSNIKNDVVEGNRMKKCESESNAATTGGSFVRTEPIFSLGSNKKKNKDGDGRKKERESGAKVATTSTGEPTNSFMIHTEPIFDFGSSNEKEESTITNDHTLRKERESGAKVATTSTGEPTNSFMIHTEPIFDFGSSNEKQESTITNDHSLRSGSIAAGNQSTAKAGPFNTKLTAPVVTPRNEPLFRFGANHDVDGKKPCTMTQSKSNETTISPREDSSPVFGPAPASPFAGSIAESCGSFPVFRFGANHDVGGKKPCTMTQSKSNETTISPREDSSPVFGPAPASPFAGSIAESCGSFPEKSTPSRAAAASPSRVDTVFTLGTCGTVNATSPLARKTKSCFQIGQTATFTGTDEMQMQEGVKKTKEEEEVVVAGNADMNNINHFDEETTKSERKQNNDACEVVAPSNDGGMGGQVNAQHETTAIGNTLRGRETCCNREDITNADSANQPNRQTTPTYSPTSIHNFADHFLDRVGRDRIPILVQYMLGQLDQSTIQDISSRDLTHMDTPLPELLVDILKEIPALKRLDFGSLWEAEHGLYWTAFIEKSQGTLVLNPPEKAIDRRIFRKFRSDRFLTVRVKKDIDCSIVKELFCGDGISEGCAKYLFHRTYKYFWCKKDKDPQQFILFAEEGPGLASIKVERFLDWVFPRELNENLTIAKKLKRMKLLFSKTTPTTPLPDGSVSILPDFQLIQPKFTEIDGCGLISRRALDMTWQRYQENVYKKIDSLACPYTGFQGRLGGIKGTWILDPALGPDAVIQCRSSQQKFNVPQTCLARSGIENNTQRMYSSKFWHDNNIVEVNSWDVAPVAATLNRRVIQQLEHLGVSWEFFETRCLEPALRDIELLAGSGGEATSAWVKLLCDKHCNVVLSESTDSRRLLHMLCANVGQSDPEIRRLKKKLVGSMVKSLQEKANYPLYGCVYLRMYGDHTLLLKEGEAFVACEGFDTSAQEILATRSPSFFVGDLRRLSLVTLDLLEKRASQVSNNRRKLAPELTRSAEQALDFFRREWINYISVSKRESCCHFSSRLFANMCGVDYALVLFFQR